ncbi:recombinase family protein [Nonomuraea jiangxiensis]|uniref:recombinase family protein n=1 Tax=Nonomuraea jiangxiensis TaxID=633440 RepID=UPI000A9DC6AD|nr:recombinase family protein [Nonomuraea jiangxiensis]
MPVQDVGRLRQDDEPAVAVEAAGLQGDQLGECRGERAGRPGTGRGRPGTAAGPVTRLSRAARSLRHLLNLAAQLREREVDLLVLKQGIDTSTPSGRLQFHMFGAFDEFLRELIVEGTLEGLASARARGRVGGRPPALDAHGVEMARALYEMKGDAGKRRYTVQQIAGRLGVSRATIYRHLDPDKPVSA